MKLEGAVNVRDLGGYQSRNGMTIKPNRLIRSAELSKLTENDKKILTEDYQVSKVMDFRTYEEIQEKPDAQMTGVKIIINPVVRKAGATTSIEDFVKHSMAGAQAENYLIEANRTFVKNEFCRASYSRFFRELLSNKESATIWHCTAGKDRAGFGAALVLSALEVPNETIMEDYLLTNEFRKADNEKKIAHFAKGHPEEDKIVEIMTAMLVAKEEYLSAAFEQIKQDFGNVDGYLKVGLGLTEEDLQEFRKMYLY